MPPSLSASTSADERRRTHRLALAESKREIQRIGALRKAGRWQDATLKQQLRTQAQVYAAHHRALAVLS
ncbi:MAG: hypothetical protein AMXMBFR25_00610 [Lysobacterales bacterium]